MLLYGPNGKPMEVSSDGLGRVQARTIPEIADVEDAFSWTQVPYSTAANDTLLAVRNESKTKILHLDKVAICTGAVASVFKVHLITVVYTNAGTEVLGVPLNTGQNPTADATATADETGNTVAVANIIRYVTLPVDSNIEIDLRGYRLAEDKAIAVDAVEATMTEASITVVGHYKN